ncbi:hypothetical protein IC617_08145 [Neiella sp. HB171785]|uniref:Uncharacterized protein n=1 Tax=Neiella litorisoli TaxID=2771431 RepID=A0A8J6QGB8_9GAMM|nr:hypothetical protein [Neiella litorisoli]MBD1389394.1 hypothetical protein [Neiella litorisoli]
MVNLKDRAQQVFGIVLMIAGFFASVNLIIMLITRASALQHGDGSIYAVAESSVMLLVAACFVWAGRKLATMAESAIYYRKQHAAAESS